MRYLAIATSLFVATLTLVIWPPAVLMGLLLIPALWLCRRVAHELSPPLPPCSRIAFQFQYLSDGDFLQHQSRLLGPIFTVRPSLKPIVCIIDLEKAITFLTEHDENIESTTPSFDTLIEHGFLRAMPGDIHRKYKPMLARAIGSETISLNADALRKIVARAIRVMGDDSKSRSPQGIDPRPCLEDMLFECWSLLFYGIHEDSDVYLEIRRANATLEAQRIGNASLADARQALDSIYRIVLARQRQDKKSDAAIRARSSFLSQLLAQEPSAASDETALANLVFIFNLTLRDVHGLCTWIVKMLVDNPLWVARTREQLHADQSQIVPGLASRVVFETLRLRQSEYLWRRAIEDIRFEGFAIPKGTLIRVCVRECQLNPDVFDNPMSFDPDRFGDRHYSGNEYSPFGMLRDACIGQDLTLTIGSVFVEEMARASDWTAAGDGPTRFGRLSRHWEPNENFRIVVQPSARTWNNESA